MGTIVVGSLKQSCDVTNQNSPVINMRLLLSNKVTQLLREPYRKTAMKVTVGIAVIFTIFFIFSRNTEATKTKDAKNKDLLVTDIVYFDIAIGEEEVGKIVIGLFGETVP